MSDVQVLLWHSLLGPFEEGSLTKPDVSLVVSKLHWSFCICLPPAANSSGDAGTPQPQLCWVVYR